MYVAPITRDTSYFASVTRRRNVAILVLDERFPRANTAESGTDSSHIAVLYENISRGISSVSVTDIKTREKEKGRERGKRDELAQEALKLV